MTASPTTEPTYTELVVEPTSIFATGYRIEDETSGAELGILKFDWVGEKARYLAAGENLRLTREPWWGAFCMQRGRRTIARAVKPSAWFRKFEVRIGSERYELRARGLGRKFEIFRHGRRVGRVEPKSFLTRGARLSAPSGLEQHQAVFLIWLTLILWKREQAAASG
ncbi:MAG: hypothetical protein GY711_16145 [bacterium]|nr:hypothetical protein [bacterium]